MMNLYRKIGEIEYSGVKECGPYLVMFETSNMIHEFSSMPEIEEYLDSKYGSYDIRGNLIIQNIRTVNKIVESDLFND